MRKWIVAAGVAAIALLLYAAAGFWLAPRWIGDALAGAAGGLGIELRIGSIRANPFLLTATLEDVEIWDPQRQVRATAILAAADLKWASLWRPAWIVNRATLERPDIHLVLGSNSQSPRNGRQPGGSIQNDTAALPRVLLQELTISDGTLRVIDRSRDAPAELRLEALGISLSGLSTEGAPAPYQLAARVTGGGTLSSHGTMSVGPAAAHGRISIAELPVSTVWQFAAPATEPGTGALHAAAEYDYDGERLVLHEVAVTGEKIQHSGIALARAELKSPSIALPPNNAPLEIVAEAQIEPGGEVQASGSVKLQPFSADLQIKLTEIGMPLAQRWLPEGVAVQIASGLLSANGRLRANGEEDAQAVYEGAVSMRDVRFEEAGSGDLLLGWRRLGTEKATLRFVPYGIAIDELVAEAPAGRVIIEPDGRVNFAEVFGRQPGGEAPDRFHASVRRLRVEQGTLDFADRSLDNDFAVTIHDLSGVITGFSTEPENPARVQLAGRVAQYGSARIRGTVNLDAPRSLADFEADFRNLPVEALTPYIVKFAGYRVESGRLSADLRYRVRDGRLIGENELVFEQLQLGKKVESAGALDVPLELAIALLTDSQGRINLDIPVSGNLSDPQFNLGGLIARAIGSAIARIVSAPFRALAGLFDDDVTNLGQVPFEPGSSALTPPAEQNVARVAKALAERPGLAVSVQGGYDPEQDRAALRLRAAERDIARRAGRDADGPLDFGDPQVLQAAEDLYLERVGSRLEMLQLREREPRYGRSLVERLAAAVPLGSEAIETLARARTQTVRAALRDHGIDPSRVRLEGPAPGKSEKRGVPTELALHAAAPVRPVARADAVPPDRETIRDAQSRLNAAGFSAGPIDGVLGPLTRSGLREFQESMGLETTGRLDDRTLAALGLAENSSVGASSK